MGLCPIPATEVAGYYIAPIKGAVGVKQDIIFVIRIEASFSLSSRLERIEMERSYHRLTFIHSNKKSCPDRGMKYNNQTLQCLGIGNTSNKKPSS